MCFCSELDSQTTQTVVITGSAIFAPDLTWHEVHRKALDDAFKRAITEVAGVEIQSEVYGSKTETMSSDSSQNRFFDLFSQVNRSVTHGRVVWHKVLDERIEQEELSTGEKIERVRVKVECEVARDQGRPDPSFQLSLALNKDVFYDVGARTANDEIIVSLGCTQDAFVTLFAVSDDTVRVLLPNELISDNKLVAGKEIEFPSATHREGGLRLRVELPKGRRRTSEMIVALATKDPMKFTGGKLVGGFGIVPTYQAAIDELMRWLSQIPVDRRTEAHATYEIRRK